jgi:hypothetical protein
MSSRREHRRYVICVKNEGYPASLEVRKIYSVIPDRTAERRGFLRVVDESHEDYLYPKDYFVAIELPHAAAKAFVIAT